MSPSLPTPGTRGREVAGLATTTTLSQPSGAVRHGYNDR